MLCGITRGFDIEGTTLIHNNIIISNNKIYTNETSMTFDEVHGLSVFNNTIFSHSSGLVLTGSVDVSVLNNDLEVSRNGFISLDSTGNFTGNSITGSCNEIDCKTILYRSGAYV